MMVQMRKHVAIVFLVRASLPAYSLCGTFISNRRKPSTKDVTMPTIRASSMLKTMPTRPVIVKWFKNQIRPTPLAKMIRDRNIVTMEIVAKIAVPLLIGCILITYHPST